MTTNTTFKTSNYLHHRIVYLRHRIVTSFEDLSGESNDEHCGIESTTMTMINNYSWFPKPFGNKKNGHNKYVPSKFCGLYFRLEQQVEVEVSLAANVHS